MFPIVLQMGIIPGSMLYIFTNDWALESIEVLTPNILIPALTFAINLSKNVFLCVVHKSLTLFPHNIDGYATKYILLHAGRSIGLATLIASSVGLTLANT